MILVSNSQPLHHPIALSVNCFLSRKLCPSTLSVNCFRKFLTRQDGNPIPFTTVKPSGFRGRKDKESFRYCIPRGRIEYPRNRANFEVPLLQGKLFPEQKTDSIDLWLLIIAH